MTKALISVTGQDTTGIIARVATKLSELNINILDITQTILSGCFTMMMVVDSGRCRKSDCNPEWKTYHNRCRAA